MILGKTRRERASLETYYIPDMSAEDFVIWAKELADKYTERFEDVLFSFEDYDYDVPALVITSKETGEELSSRKAQEDAIKQQRAEARREADIIQLKQLVKQYGWDDVINELLDEVLDNDK